MWTKIEVGKPSPFPHYKGGDGAVLEIVEDGGFILLIYLAEMSAAEEKEISKAGVLFGIYREGRNMLLLIKFKELIFDVPFNPLRYIDERRNVVGEGNILHIIGIDSITNIVRCQRVIGMSDYLMAHIRQYWAADKCPSVTEYDQWLRWLYSRYTVDELWEISKIVKEQSNA